MNWGKLFQLCLMSGQFKGNQSSIMQQINISMKAQSRKRVIVIGGGLSGLSAARHLLNGQSDVEVTVLQALDRVGGRTLTANINGFAFDEGAQFIGQSQQYVMELARQCGNELVDQFDQGQRIMEMQNKVFRFQSDIPNNLNIFVLIEMHFLICKINRMAKKVPTLSPKDCELGYQWDAISVQAWVDQNVRSKKLKGMLQLACRTIYGAELCEMSFLYFLWSVHQNKDFENLVSIKNGLQEKKTKLGTQYFSKFLAQKIQFKNGKILLNVSVRKIEQRQGTCYVTDSNNKVYECDYLIMACSPWQANKIDFYPQLSMDRKLLCERGLMGSYIKVILLYKRAYWKEKGLSGEIITDCADSPLITTYDSTKHNQNGETQPALIAFVAGFVYRTWKDREDFQKALVNKIAKIVDEPQMMEPIKVQWKAWEDEESIGGGPSAVFGPGVLSQIADLRLPEGAIHWAGTELATVSTGYMDGAIQSGIRAAKEVDDKIKGIEKQNKSVEQKQYWYTKYVRTARKWVEWL